MHNRSIERSAAYSGIVGALLFIASGVVPHFPSAGSSSADLASYFTTHAFAVMLGAWLALPAVAFIIWFALGLFDYLRDPADGNRSLSQWAAAGAIVWGALLLAAMAIQTAIVLGGMTLQTAATPNASASLPVFYLLDLALFIFAMGAFGAFAFGASHEARRKNAMPGWLNLLGYLVFLVNLAYTLSIFAHSDSAGVTGYGAYAAPIVSAIWVFLASIVLLLSVPKTV
jgi:hypothetical protein